MPKKVREPFAYHVEHDGSLGISAYPVGSRGERPKRFHHVGYVRPADGAFLSYLTFDDVGDYSSWDRHGTVDEAVDHLLRSCIELLERRKLTDSDDASRLKSLRRSASLAREYSDRTGQAMAWAARQTVLGAVANMLRVSAYEEVMKAVSEALAEHVMRA